MIGYRFENTICVYTHDRSVVDVVKQVAYEKNMHVYEAKDEADLVGVPFWLAVMDAGLLSGCFIQYMKDLYDPASDDEGIITEKLISHTSTGKLPAWLSDLFIVVEDFNLEKFRKKYPDF